MTRHEATDTFTRDVQPPVDESVVQSLFPEGCKLELSADARMLSLLSTDSPHILAQQRFTKNEWFILITLLTSYPHYAPYEILLASLTSLCPTDCRKRLEDAQALGREELKRELKPVRRVLPGLRSKLSKLSPRLKISSIHEMGYALTTSPK